MANNLPFLSPWPGSLKKVIKSYLYTTYNNDSDLQAFVRAYNSLAQQYVNWCNQVSLPVYTGPLIVGDLLDWVGVGLYGIIRPVFPLGKDIEIGPLNTWELNSIAFNMGEILANQSSFIADDDTYKRTITWLFYKADGKQFSIIWLKRRVMRFLKGVNGVSYNVDDTSDISVAISGANVTITVNNSASYSVGTLLQAGVAASILELPLQYSFAVVLA